MTMPLPTPDPKNDQEVREFFAKLEALYPEVIQAMKTLNLCYSEYLAILQASRQTPSLSTSSTHIEI
jgi:hypothetical protein